MKSASIPRPLAFLLTDELHDTSIPHFDGWQKQIVPGWHIRRFGPVYRLMHGRTSVGEVEDVQIHGKNGPEAFCVLLTSGLAVLYPIRQPKGAKQ